jgi:hypothetical protein
LFSFRNGFYFQISCSGFNYVSDFSAWGGILPGRVRGAWSRGQIAGFRPPSFFTLNFTCADPAFLPPSAFSLIFTCADHGFSPPSYDSRVQNHTFCHRRLSWMLSRTAARARSAQGASQFAAGHAAVRVPHHSDVRPVHIMKTSQVTARLCLRMSRDSRVQIRPFCPRRSSHCSSRVRIRLLLRGFSSKTFLVLDKL